MSTILEPHNPRLEEVVRMLSASVNTRILAYLLAARRERPEGGWRFLSEVASALDEAPGTVGLAIQKLMPLLEEKRHKGKRYFRTRLRALRIEMDEYPPS